MATRQIKHGRDYRGLTLRQVDKLELSKTAYQYKKVIYVSPAMYSLIEPLVGDERLEMLDKIPIKVLTHTDFFVMSTQGSLPNA